jgi:hypothetical protein
MKAIYFLLVVICFSSCAVSRERVYSHTENGITVSGDRIRTGLHTETISVKKIHNGI